MYIYLLHYAQALHHSQHYLGISDKPIERLEAHAAGDGAAFTAEMARLQIPFVIGMLAQCSLAKSKQYERTLKNSNNLHRYCSECTPTPLQMPGTLRVDAALTDLQKSRLQPRKPIVANIRTGGSIADIMQISKECSDGVGFIPRTAMEAYHADRRCIVAEVDAITAGYLLYSMNQRCDTLTIVQTAVKDEFRLHNLGRTMVDFARLSWPRATATCKVREDLPANMFWERIGFHLLQRRRHTTSTKFANAYQIESIQQQYQRKDAR